MSTPIQWCHWTVISTWTVNKIDYRDIAMIIVYIQILVNYLHIFGLFWKQSTHPRVFAERFPPKWCDVIFRSWRHTVLSIKASQHQLVQHLLTRLAITFKFDRFLTISSKLHCLWTFSVGFCISRETFRSFCEKKTMYFVSEKCSLESNTIALIS